MKINEKIQMTNIHYLGFEYNYHVLVKVFLECINSSLESFSQFIVVGHVPEFIFFRRHASQF